MDHDWVGARAHLCLGDGDNSLSDLDPYQQTEGPTEVGGAVNRDEWKHNGIKILEDGIQGF